MSGVGGHLGRTLGKRPALAAALALVLAATIAGSAAGEPPGSSGAPCYRADALRQTHETEAARQAYIKLIQDDPFATTCAISGLQKINPVAANESFLDRAVTAIGNAIDAIADWAPRIVIGAASIALLLLVLLYLCGKIHNGRWLVRVPLVGGLFAPRLSLKALNDSGAGGLKVGEPVAARIKACLQASRDQALFDSEDGDYDLDYGAGVEEFVNIVSENDSLQAAFKAARDISAQSAPVAAILDVVYGILPIRKVVVEGVLDDGDPNSVSATLTLQDGSRQVAAVTLTVPTAEKGKTTASDYARLARPAALWIHYEAAHLTNIKKDTRLASNGAASYALLREGIDRQTENDTVEAGRAYEAAIALNPENWAARVNLASLRARRLAKSDPSARARAISDVQDGLDEMRRIDEIKRKAEATKRKGASPDPHYLGDANYFRLRYQQAALLLNVCLRKVGLSDPRSRDDLDPRLRHELQDCLTSATETLEEANLVVARYESKSKRRRVLWLGLRHHTLTAKEKRLKHFLTSTVTPCTEVVFAGARRLLDAGQEHDADDLVEDVRKRAEKHELKFSYRVHYNLACYGASSDDATARDRALDDLRTAFLRATGLRRAELIASAWCDPSLDPIRTDQPFADRFAALLWRYSVTADADGGPSESEAAATASSRRARKRAAPARVGRRRPNPPSSLAT
jgi:thioredoxin-like negative regulator of GroEL